MPPREEYVAGRPAAGLRGLVAGYSGYRSEGVPPARHRGLPSPYLTFIVTLDDPLVIAAHPDPRQPASRHGTLLGGLHTAPAIVTHQGRQSGVQISLSPLGARALLGLPAGELAGLDLEADLVLGRIADELADRVRSAPTWTDRFAAIDEVLLRGADRETAVSPEVAHAWRRLLTTGGRVPVAALAAETGWSTRHLAARFRLETGLTPKAAARVVRFDRARRRLQSEPVLLADLAADAGYYDQAHLAREFGALAGCAPRQLRQEWVAEEVANVQDAPASAGASSTP